VTRKKAKPGTSKTYWPLAAGTIVMMLAVAVVNHSGWRGQHGSITGFRISYRHIEEQSSAFQPHYQEVIANTVDHWWATDPTQSIQSLQARLMGLGHFKSAKVSIASPETLDISVLTGERLFDFNPLFADESWPESTSDLSGFIPLPSETEAMGLPTLEVTTASGFQAAVEVFAHAKARGWSTYIQQIREPRPNQLELVVLDGSGTQGWVDFRSTPSHEAGTEPLFALKLKILDKQAMVYRSLTPGGGHWRIEPRGMVRRPAA
jgi:hypothetical protein